MIRHGGVRHNLPGRAAIRRGERLVPHAEEIGAGWRVRVRLRAVSGTSRGERRRATHRSDLMQLSLNGVAELVEIYATIST